MQQTWKRFIYNYPVGQRCLLPLKLYNTCATEKKDCYFTKVTFISIKFFLSLNLTCKLKIHQLSNKESHDHVKYLKTTIVPMKINNKRLTPVSSL